MITEQIFLDTLAKNCQEGLSDTSYLHGKLWWMSYSSTKFPYAIFKMSLKIDLENQRTKDLISKYGKNEEFAALYLLRSEDISTDELSKTLMDIGLYKKQYYFVLDPHDDNGDETLIMGDDLKEYLSEYDKAVKAKEKYGDNPEYHEHKGLVWNPDSGVEGFDPIEHTHISFSLDQTVAYEKGSRFLITEDQILAVLMEIAPEDLIKKAEQIACERLQEG